jgi:flagellar protein FlaJ
MKRRIPFVPFPPHLMRRVAKRLYGLGGRFSKLNPDMSVILDQAGFNYKPREYFAIAFFSLFFWTFFTFTFLLALYIILNLPVSFLLTLTVLSLVMGFLSFFYITLYPRLIIVRKVKDLEKNLLFALRHLLIQVKSGVPLFDGLVSISNGNYGLISKEFKVCTKKISTGLDQTIALEELALRNPSLNFRRIVWQITSAIKTGANLGSTLDSIVDNLSQEQKVMIRRYGSQLNPLAMMYMMLAVIIPSLGITFLIIFSAFSGIAVTEMIFYGILLGLAFFQFMFIGIVKSRRPAIEL